MKRIGADHIGFNEIGGAGEIVYRVVRFKNYCCDIDEQGKQIVQPLILPGMEPVEGFDYELNGAELLYSLVNLYHEINDPEFVAPISYRIASWCKANVQPYGLKMLSAMMEDYGKDSWREWPLLQREASFWVDAFTDDLCWLGATMDFYRALLAVTVDKNTQPARDLYFEGKLEDRLPVFESYRNIENDGEYIQAIKKDYGELTDYLLGLFPEHRMKLTKNRKTGKIGMYGDIDSVFDLAWYAFAREVATDAPPPDTDPDSLILYGSGSYICCLSCGKYVKRKGPRQRYCDDPSCQAVRKRINSKDCYNRKKMKRDDNA